MSVLYKYVYKISVTFAYTRVNVSIRKLLHCSFKFSMIALHYCNYVTSFNNIAQNQML